MWNTKLDSISLLIFVSYPPPHPSSPSVSGDMHYGQMESNDFLLRNTFNRQLLRDGRLCNVFLAGAQESWVGGGGRLIASLLPHTNKLVSMEVVVWLSACVCVSS